MRKQLTCIEYTVHTLKSTFIECFLRVPDSRFHLARNRTHLLAILVERLFHLIDEPIETVSPFDLFTLVCVLSRMRLGVTHHAIDVVLAQTRRRRNRDLLFASGAHVFR